jgi:hypothetical protein
MNSSLLNEVTEGKQADYHPLAQNSLLQQAWVS